MKVLNDYPAGTPANEAKLARDIRGGKVDFAVLPARAWAPAGVEAFDALQAPFVLGSYDVARAAIAGPAGSALEQALEKAGVKALGLVPAELRRVLAVRPLATPDAFRGMSIRIADNDTSAAVLRSLGAMPVEDITAEDVTDRLKSHALSGAETAPIFALGNGYGTFAKYITGYALFDRVDTLVASPDAWKRLSSSQQAAVTAAARDTIAYTSTLPKREAGNLAELCPAASASRSRRRASSPRSPTPPRRFAPRCAATTRPAPCSRHSRPRSAPGRRRSKRRASAASRCRRASWPRRDRRASAPAAASAARPTASPRSAASCASRARRARERSWKHGCRCGEHFVPAPSA